MENKRSIELLLKRLREGDREAAAEFVFHYRALLEARVRDWMSSSLNSDDVLSTVVRRLDNLVSEKKVQAKSVSAMRSLIYSIARNAIREQSRIDRNEFAAASDVCHSRSQEAASPIAQLMDNSSLVDGIPEALPCETDRAILWSRLHDHSHNQIASALDAPPAMVRMRWSRIKKKMFARLSGELE